MSQKRSSKSRRSSNHSGSTNTSDAPPDFQEELEKYKASIRGLEEKQEKLKLRLEAFQKLLEQFTNAKDLQEQISLSFTRCIDEVTESKLDRFTQNLVNGRIEVIHKEIRKLIRNLERVMNEQAKDPVPWYEGECKRYKDKIENHKEQAKGYIKDKDVGGLRDLIRDQDEFRESKDRTHPDHKYL